MRPSLHPRLVNGPFDDPGLFIPFIFENRAILFDLGDISSISAKDILKISHVFVTHTHIDHFIGFDHLLRLVLGREKNLYLYGPEGFINNVEGKLAGYSWNLVENYSNHFTIHVTEVRSDLLLKARYQCPNRFAPAQSPETFPYNDVLHEEPGMKVSTIMLDHDIPCLGFSIKERFHVNIKKDSLTDLGLETGPWLTKFKHALFNNQKPGSTIEVEVNEKSRKNQAFVIDELAQKIAIITPGQKVTYLADAGYTESNAEKMIEFADQSDHLFIEAAFLDQHKDIALEKRHLTALQAGTIAGKARVKQFTCFHFSPRYTGQEQLILKEAQDAYERVVKQQ